MKQATARAPLSLTSDTLVGHLQIPRDVRRTRFGGSQPIVSYKETALPAPGAPCSDEAPDICRAAEEAERSLYAATDPHATVMGRSDENDFVVTAADVESLERTMLTDIWLTLAMDG